MKILLLLIAALSFSEPALACKHSLGVGAGLVRLEVPRETDFQIGAEYECRVNPFLGVGGFFNSIFSDPSILIFGAPELLLHPLAGGFYVAGSPILETGGGLGTHLGVRLSTRLPIPLLLFVLVPSFAVDFINSRTNYWFGLGIAF